MVKQERHIQKCILATTLLGLINMIQMREILFFESEGNEWQASS